jgi:hypothetical protein
MRPERKLKFKYSLNVCVQNNIHLCFSGFICPPDVKKSLPVMNFVKNPFKSGIEPHDFVEKTRFRSPRGKTHTIPTDGFV